MRTFHVSTVIILRLTSCFRWFERVTGFRSDLIDISIVREASLDWTAASTSTKIRQSCVDVGAHFLEYIVKSVS